MELFNAMHMAVEGLRDAPGIRRLRQRAFEHKFRTATRAHLFRGVFDSYESALASAPAAKPKGYDNNESARLYLNRLRPEASDYSAMFWMQSAVMEGSRTIADLGGSVGIKYYAFRRFIGLPDDLVWRVVDVPAVVTEGRAFAASRGAGAALQFEDDWTTVDGCDVLLASGSLQYLPYSLAELLSNLRHKPGRLIVNTTPIHDRESFFTLNSIGTAFCAYRVTARREFIDSVVAQGYRLRDDWLNVGKRMDIAFDPAHSVPNYSGFYFERNAA